MWKAISNDLESGSSRLQADEPTVSYFDVLDVADADWEGDPTRTAVILVPIYPQSMRQWLNRERKRIARLAKEDIDRDIKATAEYAAVLQKELDRRTLAAKQARLDRAARDIERTNLRIERAELKRRLNGKGFRQKP